MDVWMMDEFEMRWRQPARHRIVFWQGASLEFLDLKIGDSSPAFAHVRRHPSEPSRRRRAHDVRAPGAGYNHSLLPSFMTSNRRW